MSVTSLSPEVSDTRLREAHHRIANNLALIAGFVRLQSSQIAKDKKDLSPAEVGLLLAEVEVRIQTVGRLHHLLGANAGAAKIDLGDYIHSVCGILSESVCRHRAVELVCDAGPCTSPPESAALLGLIVAELVTNAVKYAHPTGVAGRVEVRCRRTSDDELILTVADDGIGLPDGFDARVGGGLGMRVIRSLAHQLDAVLDFDSGPLGLTVSVTAPDPAGAH
jgi:two-component sensor histidine kinase